MASGIRGCLNSGFESTRSGVNSFFTNPKNRLAKFFQTSDGRDKPLKLADALLDTAGEIAKSRGASEAALEGIANGRTFVKTGRDAIGLFNIFAGVIGALAHNLKNIYKLARGITSGDSVELMKPNEEKPRCDEKAVGIQEKLLALGSQIGNAIGAATYIVGFGVCRPITNLEKHCGVNVGETAHKIGHAFPYVMMGNHVGAGFGNACNIAFQYQAFNRYATELDRTDEDITKARREYVKQVTKSALTVAEKTLEIGNDIVKVLVDCKVVDKGGAPAWFRLPVNLVIAGLGMTKVWIATE